MAYEISQFDLASRQLLISGTRPAPKTCTEIGNAKVTQSIFGKARVRIICAHDRIRRVRMLSTILAVTIAGAIWQLTEHGDKLFGNASESIIATVQVSPPAFMPEYIGPAESALRKQSPRTPSEAEIYQLATRPLPRPQPNMSLANPIAADPAVAQPQSADAPQTTAAPKAVPPAAPLVQQTAPRTPSPTAPGAIPPAAAPLVANNAAAKIPAAPQQLPKPVAVTQTATPIVAAPAAAQPAASKPAPPAAAPSINANTPANAPVSKIQPSAPASTHP